MTKLPRSTVAPSVVATVAGGAAKRYFESTEDGAAKFWEVWTDGADVTTRWGKIGTQGQQKAKTFATPEKAACEADKLIAEKTAKGYAERPGG